MPYDLHFWIRFLVYWMSIGALQSFGTPVKQARRSSTKLLLISLDGFRHDYLDLARSAHINISAFEQIWSGGFRALRVDNEFITRTGPNHFSMVTGLHEESHGLVDNLFFDPHLNDTFNIADSIQSTESRWFNVGSEPIWVTNQRHGYRSAVTMWPGSFAPIRGMLPSERYSTFVPEIPLRRSIDWIIDRLQQENVTLGLIYHHEPDAQGHKTGPNSIQLLQVIGSLNDDIAYLLEKLNSTPVLRSRLNIILTSDHGMTEVNKEQVIFLDKFINQSMYTSPGPESRVVWALWPQTGFSVDDLYTKLVNAHGKMRVYRRAEIPLRLHYSSHWRIAPLLVFAEPGWLIVSSNSTASKWFRRGEHGYDNQWPDMSPFFLAAGPGFRPPTGERTIDRIKLVDIYPMMCHLLGLREPAPHNGSLDRVSNLLHPHSESSWFGGVTDRLFVSVVLLLTLLVALALVTSGCATARCLRIQTMRFNRRERIRKQQQQQQQQQKLASGNQSIRMHSLTSARGADGASDGTRHLLQSSAFHSDDDDEVDILGGDAAIGPRTDRDDDTAWINMLHGPKSRYP